MSRLPSGSQNNVCDNDGDNRNMESIRRNVTGGMANCNEPEGRVLVLYTGGTIGMMRNEQGSNYLVKFLRVYHVDFQGCKILRRLQSCEISKSSYRFRTQTSCMRVLDSGVFSFLMRLLTITKNLG